MIIRLLPLAPRPPHDKAFGKNGLNDCDTRAGGRCEIGAQVGGDGGFGQIVLHTRGLAGEENHPIPRGYCFADGLNDLFALAAKAGAGHKRAGQGRSFAVGLARQIAKAQQNRLACLHRGQHLFAPEKAGGKARWQFAATAQFIAQLQHPLVRFV
ncbi:MAG: hypothetical protein WBO46_05170 [Caldilineaceae bacterium]